jgi:hypothetical protein
MPRSLAAKIAAMGFAVQDVRDIGLRGRPDSEIYEMATSVDAIIITRAEVLRRGWVCKFRPALLVKPSSLIGGPYGHSSLWPV